MPAPTAEALICNLALADLGQTVQINSLDPAVDTTALAARCALRYPRERDRLLGKFPWKFATREAALAPVALGTRDPKVIPRYAHVYADPSDILIAQYIDAGARPGAAVWPLVDPSIAFGLQSTSMMPAISGKVPEIPYKRANGYVFTDWTDNPSLYDATEIYAINQVVNDGSGNNYRSLQANNQGNALVNGTWWAAATDASSANLVYTAQITDASTFPEHFVAALEAALAEKFMLSIATKPELAEKIRAAAKEELAKAQAIEVQEDGPEMRPDSAFISVRN